MKSFNVLDRAQNIHANYLLEASAGTGKTFSIENIVVRLILEKGNREVPLTIEKILVVTFTRIATKDLTCRIRQNLERAHHILNCSLNSIEIIDEIPDYLKIYIEEGDESVKVAKKLLEQALFCFDQAQIFTIHGFCSRMLSNYLFEGDVNFNPNKEQSGFTNTQLLSLIRDYFRTELRQEFFSQEQLNMILNEYDHSSEKLEQAVLKLLQKNLPIVSLPNYSESLQQFCCTMAQLKNDFQYVSGNIISDFIKQAPSYEKLCDRSRRVKAEILEKVTFFASLFDRSEWTCLEFDELIKDGLFLIDALDENRLTAKGVPVCPSELCYPDLIKILKESLQLLINQARDPIAILSRLVKGCQRLHKRHTEEEERLGFDDLLKTMQEKVQHPAFRDKVREQYSVAIIDEFQDTDPVQWKIFDTLFLKNTEEWNGSLYLVGDPKQSIYAFRQADIYTYLLAAESLGIDNQASLDTNFRSQSTLVDALNMLFDQLTCPDLIYLPKTESKIEYHQVNTGLKNDPIAFSDGLGALQFCIVEEQDQSTRDSSLEKIEVNYFFPYLNKEVLKLNKDDGFSFKQIAILVSDRFQAERLAEYFKECRIPVAVQRSKSLVESSALILLQDVIRGILQPKQDNLLKTALGTRLIGWTHDDIKELNSDHHLLEQVLIQAFGLRKIFIQQGFSSFFTALLQSTWPKTSCTMIEYLLNQEGGEEFYQELIQIAELVYAYQSKQYTSPESILLYLETLPLKQIDDDQTFSKKSDPTRDAVQILTLHSSKGLEYDVVFTLGLIKRSQSPSKLVPIVNEHGVSLTLIHSVDEEAYVNYCDELDAEKMRQLYVGMTRAKYRLYCPILVQKNVKPVEVGTASPMELYLARLGQPKTGIRELYQRIQANDSAVFINFLNTIPKEIQISCTVLKKNEAPLVRHEIDDTILLTPP